MKSALSVGVFAALLVMTSCNPFEPDQSVVLGVSNLDAPATITPGSSFAAVLTVTLGGCLSFDRIETQRSTSDATITVWGKDAAAGRKDVACPQNIISETHTLQFSPPFANTFTLTVNRGRISPLMTTVQVQ